MGKHERDWAEEAEIAVTDSLNGISVNHYYDMIADSIRNHIIDQYNSHIKSAIWIGKDCYSDKGDIKLVLDSGIEVPVETKFSFEKGSGTKANISTKALQKYVDKNIKTYPQYDDEHGYKQQRFKLVETHTGRYPRNNSDYAKTLRTIRANGGSEFLESIAEITAPGQEDYAVYAADLMNKNLVNVNNWVNRLLAGNNTTDNSVANDEDLVYCVVKNFSSKKQTVEFYDFASMDSTITSVVASGKSIKLQNQNKKDVLRLSVTWKNICQGGQTPCFNVFVGSAFSV